LASAKKNSALSYFLIPMVGIVLGLILSGLATQFLLIDQIKATFTSILAGNQTEQFVTYFDQKQRQIQSQLQSISRSPDLIQLFEQPNNPGIAAEEKRLNSLIPRVIKTMLIPLGKAAVDRESIPPFSYASLDMVNRIEQGKKVFAEAINLDGRYILMMAQPISASGQVIATLFAYLELDAITGDLVMNQSDGQVLLRQQFGQSEPSILFQVGTEGGNETIVTRSLASPIWEIDYTPSESLFSSGHIQPMTFWLPSIILFILSMLAALFGMWRLIARIKSEASILTNQIHASFKGKHQTINKFTLPGLQEIDNMLENLQHAPAAAPAEDLNVTSRPMKTVLPPTELEDSDLEDIEEEESVFEESAAEVDDAEFASIFRAYDIRGVVNETLTPDTIFQIGQAIATELLQQGQSDVIIGADGRISSPAVSDSLIRALLDSGINVTNIGMVPSPVLYFALESLGVPSGVMITASHNPPEYNGFKIIVNGVTLGGDDIQRIYHHYTSGEVQQGQGTLNDVDVMADYADSVCDDIVIAQPLNIVLDCGNGAAGAIAPDLFSDLGCEVTPLYCDVDGNFPNHDPDPTNPANLSDLIMAVTSSGADLGIAFDGDGDRMVAITNEGNIIWPDRLLMLFTKDIVSRNPGADVVYDVKCSRHLVNLISSLGGRPIMCRSGHSFLKAKMQETGALLGGEMSGHICFKERWYGFDDGLYGAARLLEIVGAQTKPLEELFDSFPKCASTAEIKIPISDHEKFVFMDVLAQSGNFGDGTINDLDGLRVDYSDGWGLIRASNTTPSLTLRFEADEEAGLQRIKGIFKEQIMAANDSLPIEF
jgi:phosphomannomutase/phosphoglucomutase